MDVLSHRQQLGELDIGNLLYVDKCPLSGTPSLDEINKIAQECTSHFLRQFWKLPRPTFRLPREKPVPKEKEQTRWEKFAALKGIKKHKKTGKVYDENAGEWKPRWGKGRIDDVKDKWCIEVPENADPYEDQFEKLKNQRKENKAKNEFNRLKNISRSIKGQAPPVGVLSESLSSKNELTRAIDIAGTSNASIGRFQDPVNVNKINQQTEKKIKKKHGGGKSSKKSKSAKLSKKKKSKR